MRAHFEVGEGAAPRGRVLVTGLSGQLADGLQLRLPDAFIRLAVTAAQFETALQRERWDALVIGQGPTGWGAPSLLARVRATPGASALPVIFGLPDGADRLATGLVGSSAVATFSLPVRREELFAAVEAALAAPGGDAAARLRDEVASIWRRARPAALSRLGTLENAALALQAGDIDPGLLERALRESHALAGSLATFGHPVGSRAARCIERMLRGPQPRRSTARLRRLIGLLRRDLDPGPGA